MELKNVYIHMNMLYIFISEMTLQYTCAYEHVIRNIHIRMFTHTGWRGEGRWR